MDFIRSHIGKMHYRYPFVMKKVFYWSEVHLSDVTSYKIHILVQPTIHILEGTNI